MPWQEGTTMSERQEFIAFARQEDANIAALCRQFGISRKTAYKWLARAAAGETDGADRSRRPHTSPGITPPAVEAAVLALRQENPAWGGRKLHHALARQGMVQPPAPSTITAILRRHDLLPPPPPPPAAPRPAPPRATTPGLCALRASCPQRLVATRLHGPSGAGSGPGPSLDPARRSLSLCAELERLWR